MELDKTNAPLHHVVDNENDQSSVISDSQIQLQDTIQSPMKNNNSSRRCT